MTRPRTAVTRCLIVAVTFLSITVLGLVSVILWREFYVTDRNETNSLSSAFVFNAFPGYFRTPEEQRNYELLTSQLPKNTSEVYNISSKYSACYQDCEATTTNPYPSYKETFPIPNTPYFLSSLQNDPQSSCSIDDSPELAFHSCCMSSTSFFAPTELPSGRDRETTLQIAQFSDAKQYFEKEECCQTEGCIICQCMQTSTLVTAVVVEWSPSPKYRVDLVQVPGCCKCVNFN